MFSQNPYAALANSDSVAQAAISERSSFIRRTYTHLAIAVAAFVGLEAGLLMVIPTESILAVLGGRWTWLLVLGAFMGVSWLARYWAESGSSPAMQYAGLSLYVIAEALIFLPLMAIAITIDPAIPGAAGIITLMVFGGITAMVFITGADFSWMGRYLFLGGIAAFGVIIAGMIFGFSLGIWFSGLMVLLASGYIMYDTSNIQHHYRTDQHVAAALALFASVALLMWYVVQILIQMRNE